MWRPSKLDSGFRAAIVLHVHACMDIIIKYKVMCVCVCIYICVYVYSYNVFIT